mgnify:FL=1
MYENEPMISRINRLMQKLEDYTITIQWISNELVRIVEEEKKEQNDWK